MSARAGRRVVVVTGTDTGVGKTVVTAALAVRARSRGTVTVVKPVQTGVGPESADPDAPGDVDEVHRLTGCAVQEYAALPDPLAPDSAARLRGTRLPPVREHADRVRVLSEFEDTVVVEGAGGLLVRLDTDGGTLLDLAAELASTLPATTALEVVVVCRPGLGTLNHAELTCAALRARSLEPTALAIGAWPERPDVAERLNREDLPRVTGVPLGWVVPAGVGVLERDAFIAAVPGWQVG